MDIRTDVKYCFSERVRRTLAKFGQPFERATPLIHFQKAFKRPRNNAGPASIYLSPCVGVCVHFQTLIATRPKVLRCPNFAYPQKTIIQSSDGTTLETLRPSEVVETALRHSAVGVRCELV